MERWQIITAYEHYAIWENQQQLSREDAGLNF